MTRSTAVKTAALAVLALALAAPAAAAEGSPRAAELLNSQGCKGCHRIDGQGGTLGPALDGVGSRMDAQQIRRQLLEPKAINPGSMMPSFAHLPAEDIEVLIDYMSTLK